MVKPIKPWPKMIAPARPEHQPVDIVTQDDGRPRLETPEGDPVVTRLDRIETAIADIAERIARIDARNRVLD